MFTKAQKTKPPGKACQPESDSPMQTGARRKILCKQQISVRPQYRVFRKRSCCFITAKTLFHFGSYRRFLVLPALDLSFGAGSVVFALAGTAVDFVANLFAGPILFQGFGPFVSTEISAVSIDSFFFASHKISSNGNIMHIRSGNLLPP